MYVGFVNSSPSIALADTLLYYLYTVQLMEAICRRVVNRVQETLQCKVVRLSVDFVEDTSGKIWLVQSTECLYAVEKIPLKRYCEFVYLLAKEPVVTCVRTLLIFLLCILRCMQNFVTWKQKGESNQPQHSWEERAGWRGQHVWRSE